MRKKLKRSWGVSVGGSNFFVRTVNPIAIGNKGVSGKERTRLWFTGDTAEVFGTAENPQFPNKSLDGVMGGKKGQQNTVGEGQDLDSEKLYGELEAIARERQKEETRKKLSKGTQTVFSKQNVLGTQTIQQPKLGSN